MGVACAKMLRIDAFVIQIYTNIFKFQTGVLCYNKEIFGNIIFISQNQTQ